MIRSFRSGKSGTVVIEFALVALPLFVTIFCVLESATQYFAWTTLDRAVQQAARGIRIGNASTRAMNRDTFQNAVCDGMLRYFDCQRRLRVSVRAFKMTGDTHLTLIRAGLDEEFQSQAFNPGSGGDLMVVRASLDWPALNPFLSFLDRQREGGVHRIQAAYLFKNEPF